MTPFIINFLAFALIPLGIFFLLGNIIVFHLKRYGIKGDATKIAALFFAAVLILMSVLIIFIFLSIDWNSVSVEDFIEKSRIDLQQ